MLLSSRKQLKKNWNGSERNWDGRERNWNGREENGNACNESGNAGKRRMSVSDLNARSGSKPFARIIDNLMLPSWSHRLIGSPRTLLE